MTCNDSGLEKHGMEGLVSEIERLRAENAMLKADLDRQGQKLRRRLSRRDALTWILIVLASSAAILAPIAVWARRSFLNTDNFARIVSPLVANETVAGSLSDEVASRLFVHLEMQKRVKAALQEALPDRLDFMTGPIAGSLQALTQRITYEVITDPRFQTAWERILKLAHSAAVGIIRGDRSLSIGSNGDLVLDAGELMGNVRGRLVEAGLGFLEKVPMSSNAGEVVLFTSTQLGEVKAGLEILDTLNWMLPLLLLVLLAAAVFISTDRRKTLMWLFVGAAAAMVLSLMLLDLAEGELLGEVRNPKNVEAARVIWEGVTGNLVRANVAVLIVGLAGALAFALAGPYTWADRARQKMKQLLAARIYRRPGE